MAWAVRMRRQSARQSAQAQRSPGADVYADSAEALVNGRHDHAADELAAQALEMEALEKEARARAKELARAKRAAQEAVQGLGGCVPFDGITAQQRRRVEHGRRACRESAPEGLERHSGERLQRLCP